MPEVTVRLATPADIGALVRLMSSVQAVHSDALPEVFCAELDEPAARAVFATALREDRVLVAERAGSVAGYLWLAIVERTASAAMHEQRFAYINHIGVAPEQRRRGVGAALVAAAREEATAWGVAEIGVDWWEFNARAAAFFAKMGFAPRRHVAFARV